jgi:hypothetical protein
MASEQADRSSVTVDLPADLADWLDERATALDATPEAILRRVLSSYRATADMSVDFDGGAVEVDPDDPAALAEFVEPVIGAALVGAGETVDEWPSLERLEAVAADAARDAVAEQAPVTEERVETLESRLEALEADVADKIEDVRSRVIEVKRETDAKAPADHDHEAIEAVNRRLASLEADVGSLSDAVSNADAGETPDGPAGIEDELADLEDRLTTVAWIVRDLREARESDTGDAGLTELKREAAAADVARAKCENCGEGVDISLLTEPACPHCEATVSTVEPASGFFSKPTLRVASQLTAGETR